MAITDALKKDSSVVWPKPAHRMHRLTLAPSGSAIPLPLWEEFAMFDSMFKYLGDIRFKKFYPFIILS